MSKNIPRKNSQPSSDSLPSGKEISPWDPRSYSGDSASRYRKMFAAAISRLGYNRYLVDRLRINEDGTIYTLWGAKSKRPSTLFYHDHVSEGVFFGDVMASNIGALEKLMRAYPSVDPQQQNANSLYFFGLIQSASIQSGQLVVTQGRNPSELSVKFHSYKSEFKGTTQDSLHWLFMHLTPNKAVTEYVIQGGVCQPVISRAVPLACSTYYRLSTVRLCIETIVSFTKTRAWARQFAMHVPDPIMGASLQPALAISHPQGGTILVVAVDHSVHSQVASIRDAYSMLMRIPDVCQVIFHIPGIDEPSMFANGLKAALQSCYNLATWKGTSA